MLNKERRTKILYVHKICSLLLLIRKSFPCFLHDQQTFGPNMLELKYALLNTKGLIGTAPTLNFTLELEFAK
jgi:hypothetical protein